MSMYVCTQINYAPFRKSFYTEVPELGKMSEKEVATLRKELDGIKVRRMRCHRSICATE